MGPTTESLTIFSYVDVVTEGNLILRYRRRELDYLTVVRYKHATKLPHSIRRKEERNIACFI
jgi:hypothetical protein